jgi:hypothetical protein
VTVAQIKATALRVILFAVGVAIGMGLFGLASLVLAGLGFWSAAIYNAYFVVIILCLIAAVAAYFRTKGWAPSKRLNLAIFLTGVVALSLLGGLPVLITTPQYLIFWPR